MSSISKTLSIAFGETYSPKLSKKATKSYAWKTVQIGKSHLDRLAASFSGIHENIAWSRHVNSQVVPMAKVIFEHTAVSRFALPGLVKAFTMATDVSDFTEFLGDSKYFFNGSFKSDLRDTKVLSIVINTCGAIANVTNTLELVRAWGNHELAFLGKFGHSLAKISVYGAKPLALVGRVTVSGLCSVTLCSTFFFLAIKAHRDVKQLEKTLQKDSSNQSLQNDLIKAQNKLITAVAKFALYTPMLIFGVSNVFVLGALGTWAFVATYREKTFSPAL